MRPKARKSGRDSSSPLHKVTGAPPVGVADSSPAIAGGDYRRSCLWRVFNRTAEAVDHRVGWDKLPTPLGLLTLLGLRNVLRQRNLYDPSTAVPVFNPPPIDPPGAEQLTNRTADGSFNDLDCPRMGMAGARFGRN